MASPFTSTPQSYFVRQLPVSRWCLLVLPLTKSCPRVRGKCRGVAVTKGERLGAAKLSYYSPSVCSLPFTDRTLVGIWSSCSAAACNTPYSAQRCGFRVSESRRGYKAACSSLFVTTPQSIRLTAYCQLPVKGSLLVRRMRKHAYPSNSFMNST